MNIFRIQAAAIVAFFAVAIPGGAAPAQSIITGGTARENVRAAPSRAPGQMVTAGIVRAQQAVRNPFEPPDITEEADDTPDLGRRVGDEFNNVLFEGASRLLLGIANSILQVFGLPPLSMDDLTPPPPEDDSDGDDSDDSDDNGEDGDEADVGDGDGDTEDDDSTDGVDDNGLNGTDDSGDTGTRSGQRTGRR